MKTESITYANPETARAVEEFLYNKGREYAKATEEVRTVEIKGNTYAVFGGRMERITPKDDPEPESVRVFSLQGLVDFIKSDVDGFFENAEHPHIVRVMDEQTVEVISPAMGYLSQFDEDTKVCTKHDRGYTYGGITFQSFEEEDDQE